MATSAYLDECVDIELAITLRSRGYQIITAREVGMMAASDDEQLRFATSNDLLLITHNGKDFRRLHRQYLNRGEQHSDIIYLRQTSPLPQLAVRTAMLLDWLSIIRAHRSRFIAWGDLQYQLTQGFRPPGYTESEVRLALGQAPS